jgi:cytosine/adenosine deaminase-related metal-dependent hydrolase
MEPTLVDLLVSGGHLLTMDGEAPEIADGAIAVDAGQIVAVGDRHDIARRFTARQTLDASGCAVLPGLVDAYAHAGHGMIRGLMHPAAGWPSAMYWHATTPAWWRAEADLSALERLQAGVTTGLSVIGATPARLDDTAFADANAEAYEAAGLSLVLGVGPPDPVFPHLAEPFTGSHRLDGTWVERRFGIDDAMENTRRVVERWHGAAGGRLQVSLASPYMFGRHVEHRRSPHRLPDAADAPAIHAHAQAMRALADAAGVIIQTHMFAGSVDYALRHFGAAEVARLLGHGDVLVAHANGLPPAECEVLGAARCGIATVAFTHENLWYGVAPIPDLVQAGCAVAITTDGAAPYASLDLWREPTRAAWNQWTARGSQMLMPPETLLRMVTIDAARALRLDHRIGSLVPGKDADIVVLDLAAAHLGPVADLAQSLAFYATASDVRDVVAKGDWLLRDRVPLRVDPAGILARARAEAAQALDRTDLAPYRRGSARWSGSVDWPDNQRN